MRAKFIFLWGGSNTDRILAEFCKILESQQFQTTTKSFPQMPHPPVLNPSRDGDSTNPLSSLFWFLTIFLPGADPLPFSGKGISPFPLPEKAHNDQREFFPNKYNFPACVHGTCSSLFSVKSISVQDFHADIFPSLTTFHMEYLLYFPSAVYMEGLLQQLLVSKGKGHNEEVFSLCKG